MNRTEREKIWRLLDRWKEQIKHLEEVKDDQHRFLEGEISGLEIAMADLIECLDSIVPSDADVKLFQENLKLKAGIKKIIEAYERGYGVRMTIRLLEQMIAKK